MRDVVRRAFCGFTDRFEGNVRFMYTDAYGLVTTGRGNLIDPGPRRVAATDPIGASSPALAQRLPWKLSSTGQLVPVAAVEAAFWRVKRAWPATQSVACAALTTLRLDQADVDALTYRKLDEVWAALLARFPAAESWPAAAQLAVVSMAWAMGAGGFAGFPVFDSLADVRAWGGCAKQCTMRGAGVEPRNVANRALFVWADSAANDPDSLPPPYAPAA